MQRCTRCLEFAGATADAGEAPRTCDAALARAKFASVQRCWVVEKIQFHGTPGKHAVLVIVNHDFCKVKTGTHICWPYYIGIPPLAEQLGEPSSLFREPIQSYRVQVSFLVKDAGKADEGTHLVEVGSLS